MNLYEQIDLASRAKASADNWIGFICVAEVIIAIALVPFTWGASLGFLVLIPITASIGACATYTLRISRFAEIQTKLMQGGDWDTPEATKNFPVVSSWDIQF